MLNRHRSNTVNGKEMEIHSARRDGVLIVALTGRLDGFGAGRLSEGIAGALQDDDRAVVLDCSGMTYLSSGGIRVFIALRKQMKERSGSVALAGVGDYPQKVLEMAGVHTILKMYPTLQEAVAASSAPGASLSVMQEIKRPSAIRNGVRYSIEPVSRKKSALRVVGSLENVLYARLREDDIHTLRFSDTGYALGLGALGEDLADAYSLLGEMVSLHGSMVWLPTDGNNTPDFFAPVKDTGDVRIYSGFNVTLDGPFAEIITVETESDEGITLADLYRLIFSLADERKVERAGVVAVAMWSVVAGVCSSGVKRAPVRRDAPADGSSIMDSQNIEAWLAIDEEPKYRGDTMVSFGIGVNRAGDLSSFDPACIASLSYRHPANPDADAMYLHNHGVIFRNVPWDGTLDLDSRVRWIVNEGEFVDMRHLLDSTRIRRAKLGVAYIAEITREP